MKKQLTILIVAAMTAQLAACGKSTEPVESTTTSRPTAESTHNEISSGIPDKTDLKETEINIWTLNNEYYSNLSPEQSGDVLDDATFALNRSVEEKLNCKLNFIDNGTDAADCNTEIQKLILADDTAYDLFNATEWSAGKLISQQIYLNIADAPYLSLDEKWWDKDYMTAMSISDDTLYTLVGDCTLDRTRFLNCIYYNRTVYEKFYSDADETQENYISMVHQSARFMALPVNCTKIEAVCAVLEEMAFIGHHELLPVYYETVLKDKYTRDSESARMLDLIRETVRADFGYIFANDFENIAYIPRSLVKNDSTAFASEYARLESSAKEKSAALYELFKKAD